MTQDFTELLKLEFGQRIKSFEIYANYSHLTAENTLAFKNIHHFSHIFQVWISRYGSRQSYLL